MGGPRLAFAPAFVVARMTRCALIPALGTGSDGRRVMAMDLNSLGMAVRFWGDFVDITGWGPNLFAKLVYNYKNNGVNYL